MLINYSLKYLKHESGEKVIRCVLISGKNLGGILHQDFIANLSDNYLHLLTT